MKSTVSLLRAYALAFLLACAALFVASCEPLTPQEQAFFISVFVIAAFIVFVWFPGMIVMAFVCPSILYKRNPVPASIVSGIVIGLTCSWLGIIVCHQADSGRKGTVRPGEAVGAVARAPACFLFYRPGSGCQKRRGQLTIGSQRVSFKGANISIKIPLSGIEAVSIHSPEKAGELLPEMVSRADAAEAWIAELRVSPHLHRRQSRYFFAMERPDAEKIATGLETSSRWL